MLNNASKDPVLGALQAEGELESHLAPFFLGFKKINAIVARFLCRDAIMVLRAAAQIQHSRSRSANSASMGAGF